MQKPIEIKTERLSYTRYKRKITRWNATVRFGYPTTESTIERILFLLENANLSGHKKETYSYFSEFRVKGHALTQNRETLTVVLVPLKYERFNERNLEAQIRKVCSMV